MCKQASVDQRAMPQRIVELLACWKGQYARCCNGEIWNAIPLGLMWILWREWNRWTFEGLERSMLGVKFILHFFFLNSVRMLLIIRKLPSRVHWGCTMGAIIKKQKNNGQEK